jgi:hypothetical protein
MAREQIILEPVHHFDPRGAALDTELELEGDRVQDFLRQNTRVREVDGFDVGRQPRLQHVAKHGLAAAHFARHFHDAFTVSDGIDQRFENRPPVASVEEKIGIWRNFERCLVQSEMAVIHVICGPVVRCLTPTIAASCWFRSRPGSYSFAFCCKGWCGESPEAWRPG